MALVDAFDDPSAESDLAAYRSQYGLPPCTTANGCFRKVNQDGQASPLPSPDSGWAVEESLDLDMVSAICPQCHIMLAEANDNQDDDLAATVAMAARLGAAEISNSYGGPEFAGELSLEPFYDQPGVQVTAAAGDGSYGVSFPAASANVTSVGGTNLWPGNSSRGWTETAWPGTGSGCSAVIPKPAWQHDQCAHRSDNDVAAVASIETPVAVYDSYQNYGWLLVGGTSVSSPVVAAVYGLLGDPKAPGGSYFYSHRGNLFDVTSGLNGTCSPSYQCTAGPGYDMPTGLGTPDFTGVSDSGGSSCVNGWSATARQAYPSLNQAVLFPTTTATDGGVAALAPDDVWTAGTFQAEDGSGPASSFGWVSNIEHWDGTRWSRIPSPTPVVPGGALDSTVLTAISFDRPADGWVAGYASGLAMAAHWNGSRWALTPVLSPPSTYQNSGLGLVTEVLPLAVSAVAPDDAWLAGEFAEIIGGNVVPVGSFTEHWNGSTWSVVSIPDPDQIDLLGLTAVSATDVWAVGATLGTASTASTAVTLHWDGHAWSEVSAPVQASAAELDAVSGTSADDLWAVGKKYDDSAGTYLPLTEHWNGQAWSEVPAPAAPGGSSSGLRAVTVISGSNAWAGGTYFGFRAGQQEAGQYLLEHWDGRTWSVVATPQTPVPDGIRALSASSASNVWAAAGQQIPASGTAGFADDPYILHNGCSHG